MYGQLTTSTDGYYVARHRALRALGLGVIALGSAVAGIAVAPLFFVAPFVGGAGVLLAVNPLRAARDTTTKVCAVSAIVLGLLVASAVVWLSVSFAVNPPE